MQTWPARAVLSFVLVAFPLAHTAGAATSPRNSEEVPLPVFELHSSFWINLHHTLYYEARQKKSAGSRENASGKPSAPKPVLPAKPALTAVEQKSWDEAVAFYAENYADKDLLFSTELIQLKDQLGDFEDCDELSGHKRKFCDAGLPPRLTQILEAAAPVYRSRLWQDHDRANRNWIMHVTPLVREQGVGISERLADIYRARWPHYRIRVDVSAFANAAGAYTTVDPLRVTISSLDPRNQGAEALEVLFHEGSHGIAEPVQAAIIRECKQRDKPIPRDLWHALVLYTTAEVLRPILASSINLSQNKDGASTGPPNPSSTLREKFAQRGWKEYRELLERFWQPYLDGRSSFDDAIARMVSSL
jgi:hypothetical protein